MITQENAEKALDWIIAHAKDYGIARATTAYVTEYRKSVKAKLVNQAKGTVQEKECYAYAHPEYLQILDAIRDAVQQETEMRWHMIAAQAKIDAWRTQESSRRVGI